MKHTLNEVCSRAHETVNKFLMSQPISDLHLQTQLKVQETKAILCECLEKYTLEELSVSYNGGKDCLVMLIIYLATIYERVQNETQINSVHITNSQLFPQVQAFLDKTIDEYHLSYFNINDNLRSGFETYLLENPKIKAIVVGIRRTDPYAADLHYMTPTDHGWPQFMRINPVLEWGYHHIWHFLRYNTIEYCSLYDEGYTSIGGVHNTTKNPALLQGEHYKPAYTLEDESMERLSRSDLERRSYGSE